MNKQTFLDNFWAGFKEVLGPGHKIKSLDKWVGRDNALRSSPPGQTGALPARRAHAACKASPVPAAAAAASALLTTWPPAWAPAGATSRPSTSGTWLSGRRRSK